MPSPDPQSALPRGVSQRFCNQPPLAGPGGKRGAVTELEVGDRGAGNQHAPPGALRLTYLFGHIERKAKPCH